MGEERLKAELVAAGEMAAGLEGAAAGAPKSRLNRSPVVLAAGLEAAGEEDAKPPKLLPLPMLEVRWAWGAAGLERGASKKLPPLPNDPRPDLEPDGVWPAEEGLGVALIRSANGEGLAAGWVVLEKLRLLKASVMPPNPPPAG